ncbi:hypothetical protein TrST_g871 [Triparma strigata]|uniref:J domain-containing protein n=1 Tax=Triparma strigata TaxID=1606541 RepID=A0A9W7AUW0_9STRA|nr:hypothetical protein TrST_g871 [Triparma strigata]
MISSLTRSHSIRSHSPIRLPLHLLHLLRPLSRGLSNQTTDSPPEHYTKILNLTNLSTLSDVKKNFRALAKKHHPDLVGSTPSSVSKMSIITEAYQSALSDFDVHSFNPSSKIHHDCEIFTISELRNMPRFEVVKKIETDFI